MDFPLIGDTEIRLTGRNGQAEWHVLHGEQVVIVSDGVPVLRITPAAIELVDEPPNE
jgi:hypothetical protein